MNVPLTATKTHASEIPIEDLAKNKQLTEPEKVGELSRQFEALLLRQILSEARKAVIHSKVLTDSSNAGVYQDMATAQFADKISQSGGLGLAHGLQEQLTRQLKNQFITPTEAPPVAAPIAPFIGPAIGEKKLSHP